MPNNAETIVVTEKNIACDGENHNKTQNSDSGHPKIYLTIGSDNQVTCPYCGRIFIYRANA